MLKVNKERWRELCEQADKEDDAEELVLVARAIIRLLGLDLDEESED